jgi:ribonuclease BN (tRNA processing enzyme)
MKGMNYQFLKHHLSALLQRSSLLRSLSSATFYASTQDAFFSHSIIHWHFGQAIQIAKPAQKQSLLPTHWFMKYVDS